ncbi:hypothetical protein J1N35_004375 [Gossypium stocksii]|uniref:Cytochrome P450 n=1 Tax=Gossypium stocksii TaxID=47602 RepID=A0A9D3WDY9_9ROSI|nr:hypothetical protein J1N35_004375 [Gossypium stocksii]
MMKNPRILEKEQAEVRQAYDRTRDVSESDLHELTYLKLVIKETLRLHPPLRLLPPGESMERCEINGYEIPAKTKLVFNAWAIGRDSTTGMKPRGSIQRDSSIVSFLKANSSVVQLTSKGLTSNLFPFVLEGECVLASHTVWLFSRLPNEMENEDLDITEAFGASVRRKSDMYLIPIPYHPLCVQ